MLSTQHSHHNHAAQPRSHAAQPPQPPQRLHTLSFDESPSCHKHRTQSSSQHAAGALKNVLSMCRTGLAAEKANASHAAQFAQVTRARGAGKSRATRPVGMKGRDAVNCARAR